MRWHGVRVRVLTGAPIIPSPRFGLGVVEGPDSPATLTSERTDRMYGQTRIALLDRAVAAADRLARIARVAVRLAARTRLGPTDLYAALATARFMAAHELIDQAAEAGDDPDTDLIEIRQPLWFGGTTIVEDEL